MRDADKFRKMADYFERKCNEASASDAPWAMANLRTYQNLMSKYLGLQHHAEELERSIAFQEAGME